MSEASDVRVARCGHMVLRVWRKAQLEERLARGEAWTDSGRVFTREDGTPFHPSFVTARFQRLAFAAGCRRSGCTTCGTARSLYQLGGC